MLYDDVNIGIVIGLAEGMIVPVVRKADTMDLGDLAATTKRLATEVPKGLLAQTDLTQGTFTISNLGMFGIDSLIAVINPPEAGLLAIATIQPQPAVVDGCIVVRSLIRPRFRRSTNFAVAIANPDATNRRGDMNLAPGRSWAVAPGRSRGRRTPGNCPHPGQAEGRRPPADRDRSPFPSSPTTGM